MAKVKQLKKVDAPLYGVWSALSQSFYSSSLYVDVGKRWRGIGALYLLIVMILLAIPLSIGEGIKLNKVFNEQIIAPMSQIPKIYVQNGEAKFDKPMPYYIKNKENQVVGIIDTTDSISQFSNEYPQLRILINKNKMSVNFPKPQTLQIDPSNKADRPIVQRFKPNDNFIIDGPHFVQGLSLHRLRYISLSLIYPIIVSFFWSLFFVIFIMLAFMGQLISAMFYSFKVSFTQSMRILTVAATPMLLLFVSLLEARVKFWGSGLLLLVILFSYYSFGIISLKRDSKHLART